MKHSDDTKLNPVELAQLRQLCSRISELHFDDDAIEKLSALARRGSETAMLYLGWIYQHGPAASRDVSKVTYWLTRAAEGGALDAHYFLGKHKLANDDPVAARLSLEFAANGGYLPAMYELGKLLVRSPKTEADSKLGSNMLLLAADQGHLFAKREIASAMIAGKYGFLSIPKGLWLLVSTVIKGLRTGLTDPQSDLLR